MAFPPSLRRRGWASRLSLALALVLAFATVPGCKRMHHADTRPLDHAGMWYGSIEQLRELQVSDAEVAELAKARQAGLSDQACIELLRIARSRHQLYSSGDAVADLRRVQVSEATILELARMDQLGLWVGEAQAMRLAGLSDQILLGVARRRAAGQPGLSGASLAQLKNAGLDEKALLDLIAGGTTDAQAEEMIAAHHRAEVPSGFVRERGRRRR